jgi:hypothetical protein
VTERAGSSEIRHLLSNRPAELVPRSVKINHLNSLATTFNSRYKFIQTIAILKFKEFFLLTAGADEKQMPMSLCGKIAPKNQLHFFCRIDIISHDIVQRILWIFDPKRE